VLELGCGTGDVTLGLAGRAECIDAIEPSREMLAVARARPGASHASLRWIEASAENAELAGPYSLALAAESLHWMEWDVVLPRIAAVLAAGAVLVLVERSAGGELPWRAELAELIASYSTNREYRPYDLVHELTRRGRFRETGRHLTSPVPFAQSIDAHIESLHSRNGFSRQRMGPKAAELDRALRELLARHCPDGVVYQEIAAKLIWGMPA
jgi:SAM-dependent methyltransferase